MPNIFVWNIVSISRGRACAYCSLLIAKSGYQTLTMYWLQIRAGFFFILPGESKGGPVTNHHHSRFWSLGRSSTRTIDSMAAPLNTNATDDQLQP